MRNAKCHRQKGAVIITVCLLMLFLLGFMGIALDFGRLFVVKSELQTATDSCALSAAHELNRQPDAIDRAKSAGLSAGNLNQVDFQSASWGGKGQLVGTEITFRDAAYVVTVNPADAKYAQCQHTQSNVRMWLLQMLGVFSGDTAQYPAGRDVFASAVATRGHAQTTCPIPLALKPKLGGTAPNYGYVPGEWITLLMGPGQATNGQIGWANLDGSNNASQTVAELNGSCGTEVGDTLGTPGVQAAVADEWNERFGIYKNTGDPAVDRPDFSGYSYTAKNWPAQANAYSGPIPPASADTATSQNFATKRLAFASCDDDGTRMRGGGGHSCESITGLNLNSFQKLAAPGANGTGGHRQHGTSRRVVIVPVVNGAMGVIDYACMLMLQPLSIPLVPVQLEFIGNAGVSTSPCTSAGLPGGSAGPLVPVLVR